MFGIPSAQRGDDVAVFAADPLPGELCFRFRPQLPEEIDHHMAKAIAMEIDALIEGGGVRKVVFDMEQTRFMDSSGIGIVIGRARKLKFFEDGEVAVCNMSKRVDMIFKSAGLYDIVKKEEK